MDTPRLGRRGLLTAGAAAAVAVPLAATSGVTDARADSRGHGADQKAIRRAVRFLQGVTDAYRSSGPRLAQSYYDGSGLGDIGFIYDNALTTIALLAAGDVRRARAIGDALIYAQTHDADFSDYRLRQAYHVDTFSDNGHAVFGYEFGLVGTAVGDMSWTGLAMAQLAQTTRDARYLESATRIGRWIVDKTWSDTGLGGYTFGETAGLQDHKSTEHNIDVYGLFRLLGSLTGERVWYDRAQHALDFVLKVWNADDGMFWTGSDDGSAINKNPRQWPLDVQTWFWLSVRDRQYAACLDWAQHNLATTDTPLRPNSALTGNQSVTGVTFASGGFLTNPDEPIGNQSWNPKPDVAAVWFEGTAQLALALADRDARGDKSAATSLFGALQWAQRTLGQEQTFASRRIDGGIVAASSPLDTGFGFGYQPHLHTGATSWYVMAALRANPYRFV